MLAPTSLSTGPFVTVDIEATGCRPGTSSILEIGAAKIAGGTVVDTFSTLVRPKEPVPPVIQNLTGITDEMVCSAAPVEEAVRCFAAFAAGSVLVAHNHRFDLGFLDFEAERTLGTPFARPVLDTVCLSRKLHPEVTRNNLQALAAFYGTAARPNHRALADAVATAEIFIAMTHELHELGLRTAGEVARLCGVAQNSDLSEKLTLSTKMPNGPGVYLFCDFRGDVVYVGRARDLRSKVRSHFYAADPSDDSPAAHTETVRYISCSSPLDAQILEARLRYRYRPPFNRETTTPRAPIYLHIDAEAPYPSIVATRRRPSGGMLYGPIASTWAAETVSDAIARTFSLRRCHVSSAECRLRQCARRDDGTCGAQRAYGLDSATLRLNAERAASAIGDDPSRFKASLEDMRDTFARNQQFEQAAFYRDAARALDRVIANLAMSERARSHPVRVVVEGDADAVTLSILVHGWRLTTLRLSPDDACFSRLPLKIQTALGHARQKAASDHRITPIRLEDIAIIDAYCRQHDPLVIEVDDLDRAVEEVLRAIRRYIRLPRTRRATASTA